MFLSYIVRLPIEASQTLERVAVSSDWNEKKIVAMRCKTLLKIGRKESSVIGIKLMIEMLTCHANESCTCFLENSLFKEVPFCWVVDLIREILLGASSRHWQISID